MDKNDVKFLADSKSLSEIFLNLDYMITSGLVNKHRSHLCLYMDL